jgi:hypothetical protein
MHQKISTRVREDDTEWILHQKYLESFEMWCWRRMETTSWTDRVKNEEVLKKSRRKAFYIL